MCAARMFFKHSCPVKNKLLETSKQFYWFKVDILFAEPTKRFLLIKIEKLLIHSRILAMKEKCQTQNDGSARTDHVTRSQE